jgi:hypothetical protein
MKARVEFAPDGKHWQTIKRATKTIKLWDYFCFSTDILTQRRCNPLAKFRLIGNDGIIIGTK